MIYCGTERFLSLLIESQARNSQWEQIMSTTESESEKQLQYYLHLSPSTTRASNQHHKGPCSQSCFKFSAPYQSPTLSHSVPK